MVGIQESSIDEEDEMPVTLPKLSEVCSCMDTVLQFVEHTKNKDINIHYGNLRILREAIIKEQFQGGKQLKLDCFFKTAQSRRSADAPGATGCPSSPSPNKPPTSTSRCSYTTDTSVPPAQPTISSTPLELQSSSDSE